MGIKKIEAGTLVVDAELFAGRTFSSKGGGYSIQIQSSDEQALNLVGRAKNHAHATITFNFYEVEVEIDEEPEDPAQRHLELDENGEETGSATR